jgi:hypothetical protein
MPDDPLATAVEAFSAPLESLIFALGQGLAKAQQSLDASSIQTQEAIDSDPVLSQYGLQASWYQFPTVNMQLKMSLSIAEDQTTTSTPSVSQPRVSPVLLQSDITRFRLIAQPLSASFQTQFNYDAQAATQINLTMVPVPPPKSGNSVNMPAALTQDAVLAAALASGAPFLTTKNAAGAVVDAAGNVYTTAVNFNAISRFWYVIQYAPSNSTITPIVVAVDDATKTTRILST